MTSRRKKKCNVYRRAIQLLLNYIDETDTESCVSFSIDGNCRKLCLAAMEGFLDYLHSFRDLENLTVDPAIISGFQPTQGIHGVLKMEGRISFQMLPWKLFSLFYSS